MSNLYRIIVLHGGPKDSHKSTETYLVADNEDYVAEWISKNKCYDHWFDEDEDVPKEEDEPTFREYVMQNRGDLEDESGWEDAYYGVTKWGWEPIEATASEIEVLLKLGIAVNEEALP